MQITINSDNTVVLSADSNARLEEEAAGKLHRFQGLLTRLEVHFTDENAQKGGEDKRCSIEARPAHDRPLAVNATGLTVTQAYTKALDKLVRKLDAYQGKLGAPQREAARRRPRPN